MKFLLKHEDYKIIYPPASKANKELGNVFVHPIYHVWLKYGKLDLFRQCFKAEVKFLTKNSYPDWHHSQGV